MTIDEAIALVNIEKECIKRADNCNRKCNECDLVQDTNKLLDLYEQLAGCLEELKDYRDKNKMVVRIDCINSEEFKDIAVKLAKEQYNKAIDDFVERLNEKCDAIIKEKWNSNVAPISWAEAYSDFKDDIDELAEQLKAGGKNE